MKRCVFLLALILCLATACGNRTPLPFPVPTGTPTLHPTSTPSCTATPTGTLTGTPTQTPAPTLTPIVASTQTPALALTSTPVPPISPHAQNVEVVGHIGGLVSAVTARGGYVYAGIGSELAILDIAIPEKPVRIGYVVLPKLVQDIVVSGRYVYVLDGNLHIVDVSNPAAPVEVGALNTQEGARSIATQVSITDAGQTYIYIADDRCDGDCHESENHRGRLRVIDVSDPVAPYEVGGFDLASEILDVAVAGNVAYVASAKGVWIVDVSNPAASTLMSVYETRKRVVGIETKGNYTYVVVEEENLVVLDVSNPAHLVLVGSSEIKEWCFIPYFDKFRMTMAGSMIYLSGCDNGIRMIDISDPQSPHEAGFYAMFGDSWAKAGVSSSAGVAVVNVSATDFQFSTLLVDDSARIYVYVGNGGGVDGRDGWVNGGLSVINVSDPTRSFRVGGYDAPGGIWDVAVADPMADSGRIYAVAASMKNGVQIIDVSDPTNPQQRGSFMTSIWATDVLLKGTYAYVADQFCRYLWACHGVLRVIDFSKPDLPVQVGSYNPSGGFRDIKMADGYIYVSNEDVSLENSSFTSSYKFRVVDISDPASPLEVGSYDLLGLDVGRIVSIKDHYAYLTGQVQLVLDISNPALPTKVDVYDESVYNEKYRTVNENYAYASFGGAVRVIDASEPPASTQVGFFECPEDCSDLELASSTGQILVYTVDELGGLYILRYAPPQKK